MTVDSLFPAFAVVAPYFGAECSPEPALPDWADGLNFAVIALQQAEPLFRILALAGWRPTKLRYWHGAVGNTSATRQWCVIDLAERECRFETWTPTTVIRTTEFGDLCLAVECEEITDGAERHHGFALPPDPDHDGASQNRRWHVDLRPEGTIQLIFVTQPRYLSDAGGPPVSQEAAYFAHKRQKLDDGIDRFVGLLGSALVAGARDGANLPGLTWLVLPQHWFLTAEDLAEEDLFVDQIRKSAERVTEAFAQGAGLDTLVRMIAFPQACSLNELGRKVDPIFKNRSDTAAKAELQLTRKAARQETSPLKDAVEGSCYFDMLCMMVHTGRINPPWISVTGILGNWVDPNALVAEEPALLAEWSTWEGEEMLMLRLFGVPAVHLFQTNHPRDSTMTPKVWENVTWEYKGQQPDGKHAIGLTLGRGVRVVQDGRAGPLQLDIFHAQSRSDFRWPIPRVADLVPVPETDPGALTLYDIPVPLDPTAPGFFPVQRQDDLSATAAQTLDHEMLRAPRMYVAHIPYDLANIDAETAAGVPDNRRLTNFLPDTPPTLLVRQIENGATRFEWYREGLSDETSSGETGKTPTWAMTLKPKNPHAGNVGYCWSLDYGYLTHRPLDEDLLSELVADALLDGLLSMTTGIFQPLLSGTPLATDNVREELSEVIRPFGVAFFRLWYCGDVEIDIDRSSDSDTSFFPEIVRVAQIMDLPEQGTRLPARSVFYGDYIQDSTALDGVRNTGPGAGFYAYHALLDPDADPIPEWRSADMPAQFKRDGKIDAQRLSHVGVAESHVNSITGNWVPRMLSWSDTEYFIVSDANWQSWKTGLLTSGFREDQRIPGELRIDPTLEWIVFTLVSEVAWGFIPYVGDATDMAEFLYAYETGQDKWGEPVPSWQLFLMGAAAAIPFASSGMVKSGKSIVSAFVEKFPRHFITGGGLDDFMGLIPTTWRAYTTSAEDIRKLEIVVGEVRRVPTEDGGQVLEHALSIASLKGLSNLGELAEAAGKSLDELLAVVGPDISLIVRIDGTEMQIRVPVLADQFAATNAARKTKLSFAQFLESRRYATGMGRVLAEMFRLIDINTIRKLGGTPQNGRNWPGLGMLTEFSQHLLRPNQLIAQLRRADVADNAMSLLARQIDKDYVTHFAAQIRTLLVEFERANLLSFLISDKARSLPYTIGAMARCLELASRSILDEGLDLASLLRATGEARALDGLSEVERLKHTFFIESIADFIKRTISQSGHQHGYHFEFRVSLILREKLAPGQLVFMLQATINRLSGPDFLVKMTHGFAIIELKSLKSAGRQFGISAAQDNMTQSITGLVRMYKNGGGVDDLDGAANRFTGLFVHLVDLDYLARHVSDRSRAIFDYAGCVVRVPPEATANLPPEKLSRLMLLADDSAGGTLVFETFESWQMAAKLLDEDGFKRAAQEAMKLQAEDIFNTVTALTDKTILSNVLSSTADPQRAERTARLFAHIINEARPKGTPKVRMEDLRGPGGAQIVYDRLGLADNWWDTFTRSVPDAPPFNLEVKVMDIEELRTMSAADFGAAP